MKSNQTLKPSTTHTQQSAQFTRRDEEGVLSPKFRDNKLTSGGALVANNSNVVTKESYFGVTGDKIEPKQSPAVTKAAAAKAASAAKAAQQTSSNKQRNRTKLNHIQVNQTTSVLEDPTDPKFTETLLKKEQSVEQYRDILQGKRIVPPEDNASADTNLFHRVG